MINVRVSCELSKSIWSQIDLNRFEVPCERSERVSQWRFVFLQERTIYWPSWQELEVNLIQLYIKHVHSFVLIGC